MRVIKPVREGFPSLPEPKKGRSSPTNFGRKEMFGFDTETTRCGRKEMRSSQFAWYDTFFLRVEIHALVGFFDESPETCQSRMNEMCDSEVRLNVVYHDTVDELRIASQRRYCELVFGDQPRVQRNRDGDMKIVKRKVKRCAVAFNANFDLGVLADSTTLHDSLYMGGMEGAGVEYHFDSSYQRFDDEEYGMKSIKALFLGAKSIPYVQKRGVVWDIQSVAGELWGCRNLASVARKVGLRKLVEEGEESMTYAGMDAVITVDAAIQLTEDLESMGFGGNPDRFISGATVSKDLMSRYYKPFYLDEEQHRFCWQAYYGGMTGAQRLDCIREPVYNVVYGDLDGAYNASGQLLEVFKWVAVEWLGRSHVEHIVKSVREDPSLYWKYGSLHIEVEGDFDNVPLRVGVASENTIPSNSQGLVWASVDNYRTVMSIGDYLHSRPKEHRILRGLMATDERSDLPCLFKMTADERKHYPKHDTQGQPIRENFIPNTWWKLAGNCLYGSFANRNGKNRMNSGKWFNAIIASSITGAIRHCMWIVNESSDAYYNDTDSGLCTVEGFEKAVEALKPLNIGFSNKTHDELEGFDVAKVAIVQGSKRYAMVAEDGSFGAKCHGLGSWFTYRDGRVRSLAHDEELLETVWRCNYPDILGEPDKELKNLPVFHKFGIRTRKISNMVKEYARRQWDIPLVEIEKYGKAGNFGFLTPTAPVNNGTKQVHVVVCFEPEEASQLSDFTLSEVAYTWGRAYDKKFDYENLKRWHFDGSNIPFVRSYELQTPNTCETGEDLSVKDLSIRA